MAGLKEEKLNKSIRIASIFAISCCCVLLFPQARGFIIKIAERALGRALGNPSIWMIRMYNYSLAAVSFFIFILLSTVEKIQNFLERHVKQREDIFIFASIVIVIMSIIVRIVMYARCRSLWRDEAALARSIVARNWSELLIPPLDNGQSAPVLYVISVKIIGLVFGYSEFSLRFFSLLSFIGLLICLEIFLKRALGYNSFRIAFVVAVTALLPSYIWYSNELKPYMSDAFFVILTILLYFHYTQNKIKLSALAVLYILILGFSFPTIFFIGGILFFEFLAGIFDKNKKRIFSVILSGAVILALFGLYYHWWMLPVSEGMKVFWDDYDSRRKVIWRMLSLFNPEIGSSDSSFVMFFVPFALLGFFSLSRTGNKVAFSVVLSLFFAFLASAMSYWPLTGRLWLFLPTIILVFAPAGINFVHDKINCVNFSKTMEFSIFTAVIFLLSFNCLGYIGDKMYFYRQEINPLIHYVQMNIKEGEKLYVFPAARHAFDYKNGYGATKIGNVANDNIIFGRNRDEWRADPLGSELRLILEHNKAFLLFQHHLTEIDSGLDILRDYGTITEVMNVYDTPLYYFERKSR